jgi:Flp pilus assembly protein TadG
MNAGFVRPLFRGAGGQATARLTATARRSANLFRDESGAVLVEFTVLATLLVLLWAGVMQFGPVLQNYVTLQNSVTQAVQTLAAGRTDATAYADTIAQVSAAAGSLYSGATVSLADCNGGACTACTAGSCALTAGHAANVSATYPCGLTYRIFGFGADCTLSVSAEMLIE